MIIINMSGILFALSVVAIPAYILIFKQHPANATTTSARVLGTESKYNPGTVKKPGGVECWAYVEYYVEEKRYEGRTHNSGANLCPWSENDVIEIEYNSENPNLMQVANLYNTTWLVSIMMCGVLLLLFMMYRTFAVVLDIKRVTYSHA